MLTILANSMMIATRTEPVEQEWERERLKCKPCARRRRWLASLLGFGKRAG